MKAMNILILLALSVLVPSVIYLKFKPEPVKVTEVRPYPNPEELPVCAEKDGFAHFPPCILGCVYESALDVPVITDEAVIKAYRTPEECSKAVRVRKIYPNR